MLEILRQPWPWYISGPLIGLTVPVLLILGNKHFGISANLRHACAICLPSKIPFFSYDWRKEKWNLFFATGILAAGIFSAMWLANPKPMQISAQLSADLQGYGISNYNSLVPVELFSWESLFTIRGFIMMIAGGFMVGFGARYAGGCTSGHAITGLSNLQWPSLIATCCFMAGGFVMTNFILPYILTL